MLLFIIGANRSGTTILYQLMCAHFRVGYINNLMARFWNDPCEGIAASKALLGDERTISFRSEYGNTPNITDPHEFGHFWKRWFGDSAGSIDALTSEELDHVDWDGLRKELRAIQHGFGLPVVFKQEMLAFQAHRLSVEVPEARFIYAHRDPAQIASSLLSVRRRRHGQDTAWYGLKPPNFEELQKMPVLEQIAGQVRVSQEIIQAQVERIPEVLSVPYDDLCVRPFYWLDQIAQHFSLEGNQLYTNHDHQVSDEERAELKRLLLPSPSEVSP